jgi:hypothetical protein
VASLKLPCAGRRVLETRGYVGTGDAGTRAAPIAALRGLGAAMSWEVGTGAAGTRGAP